MSPDAPTTFRLPPELLDALQAIKERDGIPVSEQVRRAIVMWLDSKGVRVVMKKARPKKRARA
jgi:predicted DNA-binding protein